MAYLRNVRELIVVVAVLTTSVAVFGQEAIPCNPNPRDVVQGHLLQKVQPIYPPLAKQARIAGTVELSAVIAQNGSVESLQVVSGHPLLIQAAMDAVKQWKYEPYKLCGKYVKVDTKISLNFGLAGESASPVTVNPSEAVSTDANADAIYSLVHEHYSPQAALTSYETYSPKIKTADGYTVSVIPSVEICKRNEYAYGECVRQFGGYALEFMVSPWPVDNGVVFSLSSSYSSVLRVHIGKKELTTAMLIQELDRTRIRLRARPTDEMMEALATASSADVELLFLCYPESGLHPKTLRLRLNTTALHTFQPVVALHGLRQKDLQVQEVDSHWAD